MIMSAAAMAEVLTTTRTTVVMVPAPTTRIIGVLVAVATSRTTAAPAITTNRIMAATAVTTTSLIAAGTQAQGTEVITTSLMAVTTTVATITETAPANLITGAWRKTDTVTLTTAADMAAALIVASLNEWVTRCGHGSAMKR